VSAETFHTWKLVTDGDDFSLTSEELEELTIVDNTYAEYSVLPEDGETYGFLCSPRKVQATIHGGIE
jgi:hypothetical protein